MLSSDINISGAVLQEISNPLLREKDLKIYIKREDLLHPYISGNKWYKLKYNLKAADEWGYKTLLSFGGAYSNHIYALAAAGKLFKFKTIGIIRGEEHLPLNHTLRFAKEYGMVLHYLNRSDYRRKTDPEILKRLEDNFGEFYLIPEGGSNSLAVQGCREIINSIPISYDYICTPCGTGGTIAGLISSASNNSKILGFPVLKGADFLYKNITALLDHSEKYLPWELFLDYHFGGYARYNPELLDFIEEFEREFNIPLDHVYMGKMMFGIFDLISKNYFPKGAIIVVIHTGGTQGKLRKLPVTAHPLP